LLLNHFLRFTHWLLRYVQERGSISEEHRENEKRVGTFSSPQLTRLEAQFVRLLPVTRF